MSTPAELTLLAMLLGRLERLNESLVAAVCRRHLISPGELRVLAVLRYRRDAEPLRPTAIAHQVVQTSGGLTATLHRLERSGRVRRVEDPDDGRGRLVDLTADGAAFVDEVLADLADRYAFALQGVDLQTSLATVRQLIDALERLGGHARSSDWTIASLATSEAHPTTKELP